MSARERAWDDLAAKRAAVLRHLSPVRVVSGLNATPESFRNTIVEEELIEHRRLSARARRRWTNDRLLRELAGPIKARGEDHCIFTGRPAGRMPPALGDSFPAVEPERAPDRPLRVSH